MNDEHIQIGTRECYGQNVPVGIALPDLRHHIYLIGKTGSGKTTLLRNMILQHICLGHGVGLIDPHGDLAEDVLKQIPRWRTDHLVYFNPADLEFPIALNLLANVPKDDRHLAASGIVGAFRSIWRESWGPRMEYILYNSIAALLDCQNTSLLGVNRMLTDANYRARVVRQVQDPFIKMFWEEEYAAYDERFQREAIAPIQNKLGQFLLNPVIRNILGQVKCKVRFPFIMNHQRLFIANLSKGRVGHDKANLLGSLLVTQFQLAAMQRAGQPEGQRRDFYLFIDEFHNFTTDAFATLLAEARKYRLCLTLSHQYIEQVAEPIRQAVFGNVGTLLSFRVGNTDAEVLQKEFANEFIARQFVELDRYNVFGKILENGETGVPFKGVTMQPLEIGSAPASCHISNSRRRFAERRSSVESRLNRLALKDSAALPFGTAPRKPRNPRFAKSLTAPTSRAGPAVRKTRKYPGGVLPL